MIGYMGRQGKHAGGQSKGKARDDLIRTLDDVDEVSEMADDGAIVMDRAFHFDDDHDPLISLQGWKSTRPLSSVRTAPLLFVPRLECILI